MQSNNTTYIFRICQMLLIVSWVLLGYNTNTLYAQNTSVSTTETLTPELVQFSGVVMASDSLQPVFFATVWNKTIRRGTISNGEGYFSFVVHKGDTIQFSAVGFVKTDVVIPPDLEGETYSLIQLMERDTLELPTAYIYPWPTPEEFREAFLNVDVPTDDLERAQKNLERERLREMAIAMSMDANENYDYQMRQYSQSLYTAGQNPHLRIFDAFAWAKFIKALKRGDFKNKNKNKNKNRNK